MPYRNVAADDTLITAREELMAMVARGSERVARLRARSEAATRKRLAAQQRKETRKQARQHRWARRAHRWRMARSTTPLGLVVSPSFALFWYGFSVFLVPAAITALLLYLVTSQLSPWSGFYVFAGWALAPAALMPFSLTAVRRALKRERAFVEALPFGVQGYFEALGCNNEHKELTLTLCFRRNTPDWALVRDLLAAHELLEAPTDRDEGTAQEDGGRQLTFSVPSAGWHDNHGYCRWMHRLAPVAEQLHQVYPIELVVVSRR